MMHTDPTHISAARPGAGTAGAPDAGFTVLAQGVAPAVEGVIRHALSQIAVSVTGIPAEADVGTAVRDHAPDVLLVQVPEPGAGLPAFPPPLGDLGEAEPPAVIAVVTGLSASRQVRDLAWEGIDEVLVAPFGGAEACVRIGAVREARATRRELAALRDGLAAQQRAMHDQTLELGALRRVTMAVASGVVLGEVFSCLAGEVMTLSGCQAAHVAFREDSGQVTLVGVAGTRPSIVNALGMRADIGVSATSMAIQDGRPQRVDDQAAVDDGMCAGRLGWGATAAVPVMVDGEVWGAIGVVADQPGNLRGGLRRLLSRFADLASLAIGNAHTSAATRQLTLRDHLTGLYNRRAFEDALKAALLAGDRRGGPVSLLVMDIDHFKSVNDTHGHPVGDAVLTGVASRLKACARGDELLARVGGEEFALLLPDADLASAVLAGERLRQAVAAEDFTLVGRVTVSVGVAQATDFGDPTAVFRAADEALYRSKREGRNRVSAAGDSPSA